MHTLGGYLRSEGGRGTAGGVDGVRWGGPPGLAMEDGAGGVPQQRLSQVERRGRAPGLSMPEVARVMRWRIRVRLRGCDR
jgi:hypothetical protein